MLGNATIKIDFDRTKVAVSTGGACVGLDKTERVKVGPSSDGPVSLSQAIHRTTISAIRSLPKKCKVPNLPGLDASIEQLGAVLADLDD